MKETVATTPGLGPVSIVRGVVSLLLVSIVRGVVSLLLVSIAAIDFVGGLGVEPPGLLGLAVLLSEHLTLAALVVGVPFVLRSRRSDPVRIAFLVFLGAGLIRYGDELLPLPPRTNAIVPGTLTTLASWNLEVGSRAPAETVDMLVRHPARLIGLEELTPDVAAAIDASSAIRDLYPFRVLEPRTDAGGLALLSTDLVEDVRYELAPARLSAVVRSPAMTIHALVVHPFPAPIDRGPLGLPVALDTARRDADLVRIRDDVDAEAAPGEPVAVFGDLNTAPSEPAFTRFAAGLSDAHVVAGVGPGWTWRPSSLEGLGVGLLRIDVVLTGPFLVATREQVACPAAGDHCLLIADIAAERP